MRTNNLGDVALSTASRKREKFNLTHDVNTTCGFGETQPLVCRLLPPNTKTTCGVESLVRLAPMLSPTFGRMNLKFWHYFVGMSDLGPRFAAMMAQEPISRGSLTYKPTVVPNISLKYLSSLVLCGAFCTIYQCSSDNSQTDDSLNASVWETYKYIDDSSTINSIMSDLSPNLLYNQTLPEFGAYTGTAIKMELLFPNGNNNGIIPLGNPSLDATFFLESPAFDADGVPYEWTPVTLDGADYVITKQVGNRWLSFAFRLSAFGKRIRKILLGCGYQVNFNSDINVNAMPLFAYFKAYFDVFGLTLYQGYETTPCAKLLTDIDIHNTPNISDYYRNNDTNWWSFVFDLGCCWVTDPQDFVSAHTSTNAVSPSITPQFKNSFVDVSQTPNITTIDSTTETNIAQKNGHSYIDNIVHGHLDSELLKRLYRWTNRNTIAGRRIAELLKAQGLGAYMDECKPNFIGHSQVEINVNDVTATAETFKPDGATAQNLGSYAGKGIGYGDSKTFTYENSEFGYWVTLCAVVPSSGYCQAIDGNNLCVDKFEFYNPEFDGLGMELDQKVNVVGSLDWVSPRDGSLDGGFGYIPRYSSLKVAHNKMNGDFSLRGSRSAYLPYTLDKIIDVGERFVEPTANGNGKKWIATKMLRPVDLPMAGNSWRFNSRYPWLNNFKRIFVDSGALVDNRYALRTAYKDMHTLMNYEITGNMYDDFMVHNIVKFIEFAPMLPISESFETYDEETEKPDTAIGKA